MNIENLTTIESLDQFLQGNQAIAFSVLGKSPIAKLKIEEGIERVTSMLRKIEYGEFLFFISIVRLE